MGKWGLPYPRTLKESLDAKLWSADANGDGALDRASVARVLKVATDPFQWLCLVVGSI